MTTTADRAAWLASLKPGDEVAWRPAGMSHCNWTIATIHQRTKSQVLVTDKYRFDRKGIIVGKMLAGDPLECEPVTTDVRESIERTTLAAMLHNRNWQSLSLSKLRRIKAILEEAES